MKKRWKITLLLLFAFALLHFHNTSGITAEQILNWQPENLILAAVAILCFFVVKSALVFIPIMLPQLLAGHIYDRETAIFLNLLGLIVVMAVPYWIGKHLGSEKMEKLMKKYPKQTFLIIFGFILGSLPELFPRDVEGSYLLCGGCVAVGFLLAYAIGKKEREKLSE